MKEIAYAKLNLALHVRAREPDGYHRLETIFAFADSGDSLEVAADEGLRLDLAGPFAKMLEAEPDNLVLRAARALKDRFQVDTGAALRLEKMLPVAAGLGGGSADAAAALRLLARWWRLDVDEPELEAIAAGLGADVAACVRSVTVRGEGRGERLVPVAGGALSGMPILIVNPLVPVSTPAVFRGWSGVDHGPLADGDLIRASLAGRNDLEAPALAVAPVIGQVLSALGEAEKVVLRRMSGSGASCFALFEDCAARDGASARLAETNPGWWRLAARLR